MCLVILRSVYNFLVFYNNKNPHFVGLGYSLFSIIITVPCRIPKDEYS